MWPVYVMICLQIRVLSVSRRRRWTVSSASSTYKITISLTYAVSTTHIIIMFHVFNMVIFHFVVIMWDFVVMTWIFVVMIWFLWLYFFVGMIRIYVVTIWDFVVIVWLYNGYITLQ